MVGLIGTDSLTDVPRNVAFITAPLRSPWTMDVTMVLRNGANENAVGRTLHRSIRGGHGSGNELPDNPLGQRTMSHVGWMIPGSILECLGHFGAMLGAILASPGSLKHPNWPI
jgi:hypothetical protein